MKKKLLVTILSAAMVVGNVAPAMAEPVQETLSQEQEISQDDSVSEEIIPEDSDEDEQGNNESEIQDVTSEDTEEPGLIEEESDVEDAEKENEEEIDLFGGQYIFGNSAINLLNGGYLTEDGTDAADLLGTSDFAGLNIFGSHVYYISGGNCIKLQDTDSGELQVLYQADAEISHLYVVNDRILIFIEDGNVMEYDTTDDQMSVLQNTGDIVSVLPTEYGMFYIRGELLHWNIYADDTLLLSDIYQYYPEDGYLIYTQDETEYQLPIAEAFATQSASVATEYSLGETVVAQSLLDTENADICQECEENAEDAWEHNAEAEATVENADVQGISLCNKYLTAKQQAIVDRAEEQYTATWTAKADVIGWRQIAKYKFNAGTTYNGVPYGQPVDQGYWVGYEKTTAEFVVAANTAGSEFYTAWGAYWGNNNAVFPSYSNDCSTYVSYCWGLSSRYTTYGLPYFADKQNNSIYSMQVGDAFISNGHTVLVEDMTYSGDTLTAVTIVEQTPPKTTKTVYSGTSGSYSLNTLANKYSSANGYSLYRLEGMDTVTPEEEARIISFVTRLYNICLDRNPDANGLSDWVSRLETGEASGTDVAYGFVFSQEFKNKNLCNEDYVEYLYKAIMGRGSDSSGKANWVGQLTGGSTREAVFNGFVGSQEFTNLCALYGIAKGNAISVPKYGTVPTGTCSVCGKQDMVTQFVTRLYKLCLGRTPDAPGLKNWTNQLWNHTNSGSGVAYGFVFSPEFTNKKLSNEDYVETLYQTFLGRGSDAPGKANWVGQLNRGASRKQIFDGFVGSQEFTNICNSYGIVK